MFSPFKTERLQRAAFFKGSGAEARLRRKLVACFVLVSYMGWRMALLKHPAPKMSALWGSDCVEYVTSTEGTVFQA